MDGWGLVFGCLWLGLFAGMMFQQLVDHATLLETATGTFFLAGALCLLLMPVAYLASHTTIGWTP